jgi:hypothetical protein
MPILYQPLPLPPPRPQGSVLVVPHYDVQWARPIFRAPSLPTPSQLHAEIPFTALRSREALARSRP